MRVSRYEFLFRTSRLWLWLGLLGACDALALGLALVAGAAAARLTGAAPLGFDAAQLAGIAAAGVALAALGARVLRRSALQAFDCRIGEAGIYFRTILREAVFVPWGEFGGFRVAGAMFDLAYAAGAGRRRSVRVEVPGARASDRLRLRTFLDGKLRARAASLFSSADAQRAAATA